MIQIASVAITFRTRFPLIRSIRSSRHLSAIPFVILIATFNVRVALVLIHTFAKFFTMLIQFNKQTSL